MILNASGCLDALAAPDVAGQLDVFVTKTVTPLPREGNAPPRIAETDVGMLNTIGLANPGIDAFVADVLPQLTSLGIPIWVSVGGFSADDYTHVCSRLEACDGIDALELNLSCPNVEEPSASAQEIVAAARAVTSKPLYAKLTAAVPDVAAVARSAVGAGADGLSLINTVRGLALDERTLTPQLSLGTGGLSGPALKPVALAAVYLCARAVDVPIVGMGGVATGRDALELLAVGASSVALGTVLFSDPGAPTRVREELLAEAAAAGVENPVDLRGIAHGEGVPGLYGGVDNPVRSVFEKSGS